MTKAEIADILEEIAQLLDLKGENAFKIRAYQNAARALEMYPGDLERAANEGALEGIDGIGKAIAVKITELVQTGRLEYFEELKAEFPATIFELFDLQGLGAKKIKALHEHLGVASIAQLEAACRDGRLTDLPGFGKKTAEKLLTAIAQRQSHASFFRLGDVAVEAAALADELRAHPAVTRASEAGSFRRRKEVVRDLDFVVSTKEPAEVGEYFAARAGITEIIAKGPTKISVRLASGIQCDLRMVSDAEYPFALNYFTGSKEHNIAIRARALSRGWSLNEYRFSAVPEAQEPAAAAGRHRRGFALRVPRARVRSAGDAREPRRSCPGGTRHDARVDRAGEPARRLPLPHSRQRRPQHARGNGGRRA